MNRLWVRLLVSAAVALAVAVGTVGFAANRLANSQFNRFVARRRAAVEEHIGPILIAYYRSFGWSDAQDLVRQIAAASGDRIAVFAPDGSTIADSNPRSPLPDEGISRLTLVVRDEVVASVLFYPETAPAGHPPTFGRQLGRSVLAAVLLGFVAALAVSLVLSRGIARPVEAVTKAALDMAEGKLEQRVPEGGPGELGQLAKAFNTMAEAVARSQRLRQDMVADVAHELRTPLTVIRGYLEALQDGVAPATPENIDVIHNEAVHLQGLVEDLQELALAEAQQLELHPEPTAIGALVAAAVAGFSVPAASKSIRLDAALPPGLPTLNADRRRIAQVLRNLLANAVAHTPAGGHIEVGARREGADVKVYVRDSGPGVAPEDQPYVFERFYRADKSRARATGGAGLGLTIARRLVEAHGGTIGLDSKPGEGSTFWFRLPAAVNEAG